MSIYQSLFYLIIVAIFVTTLRSLWGAEFISSKEFISNKYYGTEKQRPRGEHLHGWDEYELSEINSGIRTSMNLKFGLCVILVLFMVYTIFYNLQVDA